MSGIFKQDYFTIRDNDENVSGLITQEFMNSYENVYIIYVDGVKLPTRSKLLFSDSK